MKKKTYHKGLALGIIILFFGMIVVSTNANNVIGEKTSSLSFDRNTLYVGGSGPGNYSTIQDAIDAAVNGDEVVIADGSYTGPCNKNLDFHGKAITVRSENGSDHCIINMENDGRGFYFNNGETSTSIVEGLTIANGNVDWEGGGIYCYQSSPTIRNCIIKNNDAFSQYSPYEIYGDGGGIYSQSGSPIIDNCIIRNNWAGSAGGGIYCLGGNPIINNCTILNNDAGWAGGIYCSGGVTISNCTIEYNDATFSAGGIDCRGSSTISNCIIQYNTANGYLGLPHGGGIYCGENSNPTINNCIIRDNTVEGYGAGDSYGGGIHCDYGSSPIINNCLISGNTVAGESGYNLGGGISCYYSNVAINGCTISNNIANDAGGGICCYNSNPTITSSILWFNTPDQIYVDGGSPVITYSDVQGGWPGGGNIDLNPLFIGSGDYHLQPESPCIDTGDPNFLPQPEETDIDGDPRVLDGNGDEIVRVDMGADEFVFIPRPDLDCDGSLSWTEVKPGTIVEGSFTVSNIGDPTSTLDWEIESYPEWGTWTFKPSSGDDLTPEDNPVVVAVKVVAPDESETEFTGEIKIVNSENPDDYCIIDVSLATPVNQHSIFQKIVQFLENLIHRFPLLEQILGRISALQLFYN